MPLIGRVYLARNESNTIIILLLLFIDVVGVSKGLRQIILCTKFVSL